jgi:xanthine dehydrogenase YagR molybdenum-binding subunit
MRTNTGAQRAMRAPGHPQSCFFTDCALDDFAARVGLDPMQVRLRNLPTDDPKIRKQDPGHWNGMRGTVYRDQIEMAAKLSGWKDKWHAPGRGPQRGPWRHGIGMALHTWGGSASAQPDEVEVVIAGDGSVTVRSSTQDLGTAQRTASAIVAAETLGLNVADITVEIGDSRIGQSHGSGGSTTIPTQAPATLLAATDARTRLFERVAARLNARAQDLEIAPGIVRDTANNRTHQWRAVCAHLGKEQVRGRGSWDRKTSEGGANKGLSNVQVGGVQTAEVWVDTETGVVRCTECVAVQDCGLIINKLACESQVAGGVIMGLNYALYEELILDRHTGRVCNADMEFYKLGGISDMPRVIVHMMDMPERGVIGIGEPPTISTHAAIANAVHNALGVRVPQTPLSPDRILAALAAKGGKK